MFTIFRPEFFNYGSCLAARINSYGSHTNVWEEKNLLEFGTSQMKLMDSSSLHWALRSQQCPSNLIIIIVFPSHIKEMKKKRLRLEKLIQIGTV